MNELYNPNLVANLIEGGVGFLLLKWVYVAIFGFYLVFSLVVMTQIRQMLASLNGELDKAIFLIGLIQVFLAVAALVAAIVIL